MKKYLTAIFVAVLAAVSLPVCQSCSDNAGSIGDKKFMAHVRADFDKKKAALPHGDLFAIFEQASMTQMERDAMMFLYAYMPVGDITDYTGQFYLDNVRSSIATRAEMPWGSDIPDDIFRHFVLPVRVNNESLDSSRMVFHDELLPRVQGMSMSEAILEVNHWCHEKATYQPSDARTSSPLATVSTAYGRCGEESTFLVAALRSIGIPARQVYTPRWAHTDDNHAWVEAWADGEWHFLGACEPEPVLDLGWFNAPASRGMLMHTKVFGYYDGPEEVMRITANYTEINVIDNYAPSAKAKVVVTDTSGMPVQDALVEFKLYNYAEFYTVSRQSTDSLGRASLSAGLGDMLVMAFDEDRFGLKKVTFGTDTLTTIVLEHEVGDSFSFPVDIVPPVEKANLPIVNEEVRAENDRRFNLEDSIRNSYVATFPSRDSIERFAARIGATEPVEVIKYVVAARGNYKNIMSIMESACKNGKGSRLMELLSVLSEKDLRDVSCAVLEENLYCGYDDADAATVMSPRVADEALTLFRKAIISAIPDSVANEFKENPQNLVEWCRDSLTLRSDLCTVSTIISPVGVLRSRVADRLSRDVFFVAMARTFGIPAWKDRVTGNVYFKHGNETVPVDFDGLDESRFYTGGLMLGYNPIPRLDDPEYYRHFTLSKFEGVSFDLLDYSDSSKWSELFKRTNQVEAGYYMLVSGSRLANGNVLANVEFFNVQPGKAAKEPLKMRDNAEEIRVIGNFNSESKFVNAATGIETSVLLTSGRGYFIVGLLAVGQEPTNHALRDIAAKASEFESWGRSMILLFPDEKSYERYMAEPIAGLPSTVTFGIDKNGSVRQHVSTEMNLPANVTMPVFVIADTFNRVVFESHGYTIGFGNRMVHTIKGL